MAAPVFNPSGNAPVDAGASATLVATAAGTYTSPFYQNNKFKGVEVVIDITAITGSLTVTIEGYDPVSGKKFTVLASAALAGVATTVLRVYPGLTVGANLVASDHAPAQLDIKAVVATGPCTATISVNPLV